MKSIQRFQPDLIIEATSTCDRQCPGCYAPNMVTGQNALQLLTEKPQWFLSKDALVKAFQVLSSDNDLSTRIMSVRGGEPTRHPRLFEILKAVREFTKGLIYLETHGRWVLSADDNSALNAALYGAIADTQAIVKISFDQMHGLSSAALREITTLLDQRGVPWCVAITEGDADLIHARSRCDWVANDRIFFQEKARTADGLVRPTIAAISVEGKISTRVSVRADFGQAPARRADQALIRVGVQQ